MEWLLPFGTLQWMLLCGFLLAFAAYLWRSYVIAKRLGKNIRNWFVKLIIRIVYLFLLFVALQGPLIGKEKQQAYGSAKEIWLVFDVSTSMAVSDVIPNRLERAKQYAKLIIDRFKGEKIGIIIFAGESFVHCPQTVDSEALLLFLQAINTSMIDTQGSDIKALLKLLAEKQQQKIEETLVQAAKASILFTDGEFHLTEPLETDALLQLKKANHKVYCIGIGTAAGGKVPKVRAEKGQAPISILNTETLNEISAGTQGEVFTVSGPQDNPITKLSKAIEQLQGENKLPDSLEMAANKYQYAIGIALIFLLIDIVFTVSIIKLR